MTKSEFAAGWKLLILQPWGWRYRSLTSEGKPSEESRLQMELYYNRLHWGHPQAWLDVVNLYVEGEEWPSIQALKQSLSQVNPRYMKSLPDPVGSRKEWQPTMSTEEANQVLQRLGIDMKL